MIIEDKLLSPYFVDISNRNVTVRRTRVSNQGSDEDSKEYETSEGNFSTVYAALRKIEKLKQENAEVTIDLQTYILGLEKKMKAYDSLLAKFDIPNIDTLAEKVMRLEKKVEELSNYLKLKT